MILRGKIVCDDCYAPIPEDRWRCQKNHNVPKELYPYFEEMKKKLEKIEGKQEEEGEAKDLIWRPQDAHRKVLSN